MVALVYSWWNIFGRLAEPDKHLEAITSRPLLLAGIAERTRHGRQTTLRIAATHGNARWAEHVLTGVARFRRALLERLRALVRAHWGIENRLHHVHDLSMDEDRCRVRIGGRALACLRNLVLTTIRRRGTAVREAREYFREDRVEAIAAVTGRVL